MASVFRRSTAGLVVCCGVLLASQAFLVSVPTSAASGSTSCTELQRWAQPYRDSSMTLDQLARFDRIHRVAIFNTVSVQVRASLWQEQLRRFDRRPDLTPEQHALIADAITVATPALYAKDAAAVEAFHAIEPRFNQLFVSKEHKQALQRIGDLGTVPLVSTVIDKLASQFVAQAQPLCNCFSGTPWDDCPWSGICNGGNCFWMSSGCGGWLGQQPCNGLCG
jgi:hypothetical protein